MSAASKTNLEVSAVDPAVSGQFETSDERSMEEVEKDITVTPGHDPVMKRLG